MSSETEDSLARLVTRQSDAMHKLREQRDDLKAALVEALSETGTNGTEPDFSVRPWIAKARAILKKMEVNKNGSHS